MNGTYHISVVRSSRLPDGPTPKHVRLGEAIVRDGLSKLSPGEPLPGERELEEYYNVSRATVRHALRVLEARGLVVRRQGKGTFKAQERDDANLLTSFTELARRRGQRPSSRVVSLERTAPPRPVAERLGAGEDEPQWRLERVRLINGIPVAHEVNYYPAAVFPGLDHIDVTGSMYATLADVWNAPIDACEQRVWCENASAELAAHLDVERGAALLAMDRVSSARGTVVEVSRNHYRGDRYEIVLRSPDPTVARLGGTDERNPDEQ